MLTLLRISEQLLDSQASPALRRGAGPLNGGNRISMNDHSRSDGDIRNYPQHSNHHRHHHPHQGCSACLDKKPVLNNRSMKTVSFSAHSEIVCDGTRTADERTEGSRLDVIQESAEGRRALRADTETGKLRSWISVVGDINELSSEPERGTSGTPHKDHHQLATPASARKRRERHRSIPNDGPAMTDLGTPLAKPRRNSDGATVIRRFLVTPVEDFHEDSFADMSPPPLPKTPPPSEPTSLVFGGPCPVNIGPCVRPSILKKSSPPDSASKPTHRYGTFTLHTNNDSDTHGVTHRGLAAVAPQLTKSGTESRTAGEAARDQNSSAVGNESGFTAKLRSNVDHELVRGPGYRATTTSRGGTSDAEAVTVDQWLGDRGVDFDPVESPTRGPLRRSISEASGLRQKKVSFDLEHVDVFLLEQELISDEQSAYLNERFRQFLGDSLVRANQGSLRQEDDSPTSLAPGRDDADGAIAADDDGEYDNGIELVKKTLTDDDKTWLKT